MRRGLKWYRRITAATAVAIAAACGSESGPITTVQPQENASIRASEPTGDRRNDATALVYEGAQNEVEAGDAALVQALVNLPSSTSTVDLVAAANHLLRARDSIQTPLQIEPTVANVDYANPRGVTMQDVAAVTAAMVLSEGDREEAKITAAAQKLVDEPVTLRAIPGQELPGSQPGSLPRVVRNDAGFETERVVDQIGDLPDSTPKGDNLVFPPGTEILFPTAPDPDQALRVSYEPPLTGARNEAPQIFSADFLGCSGSRCFLPDIAAIMPLGFKADERTYTVTYEFTTTEGGVLVVERPLTVTPAESLSFADPNLEAAVRDQPGVPDGPITTASVSGLRELNASDREIELLDGIAQLNILKTVDVSDNNIESIGPLGSINTLQKLDADNNDIEDIAPVEKLEFLTELEVNGKAVVDVSPLRNLERLETLSLRNNSVASLSDLGGLPNLRRIILSGNSVTSLSLASSSNVLEEVELRDNSVGTIDFADAPASLKRFVLDGNDVASLRDLTASRSLESLELTNNSNLTLDGLRDLANLKTIEISGNANVTIRDLGSLPSLTDFNLARNSIVSVFGADNQIGFESLNTLIFNDTSIRFLGEPQSDLTSLSQFLGRLTIPTFVGLRDTGLSELSSLQGLSAIAQLDLSSNPISNIGPLVENDSLGAGDVVNLSDTQLDRESTDTFIPQLRNRGVEVQFEGVLTPPTPTPRPSPTPRPPSPQPSPSASPPPPPSSTPLPPEGTILLNRTLGNLLSGEVQVSVQIPATTVLVDSFTLLDTENEAVMFVRTPFELFPGFTSYASQTGFDTLVEFDRLAIDGVPADTCVIVHIPGTEPTSRGNQLANSLGCPP